MESASRAELWQRCTSLEQELRSAEDKLGATTKQLQHAEKQLGALLISHVSCSSRCCTCWELVMDAA
jgi:hypothetical protein